MIPDTHSSILPWVSTKFVQMQLNVTIDILWESWLARGRLICCCTIDFRHSQACVGLWDAKCGCYCHTDESQDMYPREISISEAYVSVWNGMQSVINNFWYMYIIGSLMHGYKSLYYLYSNIKPTEDLFAFHLQFSILTLGR